MRYCREKKKKICELEDLAKEIIPNGKRRGKRLKKKKTVSLNYGKTSSCLIYMYLESWKKRRGRGQKKMIETIMAKVFQIFLKLVT